MNILIVDDKENTRRSLATFLRLNGHETTTAASAREALDRMKEDVFHAVLTDFRMPEMNGIELTRVVKELSPDTEILIMSAYGTIRDAVTAMRLGAYDYLTKPLQQEELLLLLSRIDERFRMIEEVRSLRARLRTPSPYLEIVGESPAMQIVYEAIDKAGQCDTTVLLTGETGTGKEIVARAIHHNSARAKGPFVAVNCASLPETLIESELFGHVKGAFTGAVRDRLGKIRKAEGGTLFMDELPAMPMTLQAKLLRILEMREVEPVGGDKSFKVDIRIVTATNEDLTRAVRERRFRDDLLYRLNVMHILLPPLRDRKEDIPSLAFHFLKLHCDRMGRDVPKVSPSAMDAFLRHTWPGNVREFENVIQSILTTCNEETIEIGHLPRSLLPHGRKMWETPEATASLQETVSNFERFIIEEKLRENRGNVAKTSRDLKVPLRSMRRKIEKYNLLRGHFRGEET